MNTAMPGTRCRPRNRPARRAPRGVTVLLHAVLLLVSLPAMAAPPPRPRLDALSDAYAALGINAVVLVGDRDGVRYERAFGRADLDTGAPLEPSTRFKTESVGKMFTATRVMQLVGQGRLRLDDSAAKYLPGWNIKDLDRITVHRLLGHTAGLASMWDHPKYDFSRSYTPEEMQRIVEEVPAVGPPGGKYSYSNNGYYLLGRIIEAVTGEPFDVDLRRNVFDVAGMDMDHLGATAMPPGTAQPYIFFSSDHWRSYPMGVSPQAGAAGGWVGDARALYAFARSYLGGGFIDRAAMRRQWSADGTVPIDQSGNHYGYGTEVFVDTYVPGRTIVGHSGGGGGFSIDMFMEPASGTIVVLMSNMYGMNRGMSMNYMRAALGLPTRPAMHSPEVRTVDRLLRDGLAPLQRDPARFFAALDVQKYGPGFLGEVAGFLMEIGREDLARGVEETSRRLHGEPQASTGCCTATPASTPPGGAMAPPTRARSTTTSMA